jgi:hypothetical protein
MSDNSATLVTWVTKQATQARNGAIADRLEIQHTNSDGSNIPVGVYPLPPDLSESLLAEVIAAAYGDAAEHAQNFPTPQTYSVTLHWPGSASAHGGASRLVRLSGAPSGALSPTESANAAGLTGQLMRHLEASARINATVMGTSTKFLSEELARKDARIAKLEADRVEQLELLEQIATAAHDRQLDLLKAERGEKRLDDGLASLKLLAPVVVAGMSKKLGGPTVAAQDPQVLVIKALLKSLTREQLAACVGAFTPTQSAVLVKLYQSLALADEPGFSDLAEPGPAPAAKQEPLQ